MAAHPAQKFALCPVAGPRNPIALRPSRTDRRGESRLSAASAAPEGVSRRRGSGPGRSRRLVIKHLERDPGLAAVAAIGHRVVHGGNRFADSELVSAAMLDELRRISPFDPEHLPGEIALIEAFASAIPDVPQVACFDTGFHRTMPRACSPDRADHAEYWGLGIRRSHGFHGLHLTTYLMAELERVAGSTDMPGDGSSQAHLGSGASLAAVREGRCLDTTMGFTPASGLVMETRCGDLDPSLNAFLANAQGMTPQDFHRVVNHESGLLGVSETSRRHGAHTRCRRETDFRAAEAFDLFCYRVKLGVAAMAAVVGGLDTLVFSGGIGENSAEVRRHTCEGLEFLGIAFDEERNASGEPIISADSSPTSVRVIRTDEETVIARETWDLVSQFCRRDCPPRTQSIALTVIISVMEWTDGPEADDSNISQGCRALG